MNAAIPRDRDRYGGWTSKKFTATGYFRLQEDERRWWVVTPEGHPFVINAMDHISPDLLRRNYNRDYWEKRFGISADVHWNVWMKAFLEKKLVLDKDYLGFNCASIFEMPNRSEICPFIPRIHTVENEYWRTRMPGYSEEHFLDVFSDEFATLCDKTARKIVQKKFMDNKWIVGFSLTDSPILTDMMAMPHTGGFFHKPLPGTTTWPVRLRNLGADAPGKQAYVNCMKERYTNHIEQFNYAYNTDFSSWDALIYAENWRQRTDVTGNVHEERDNEAFLTVILDVCWGTQVKSIRKYDQHHLILGDTLNLNEPLPDAVIRTYVKHFPTITYQYYGTTLEDHMAVIKRLRNLAPGVPMWNADSGWSVCDPPRMPDTLGPQCANQLIRASIFNQVYRTVFTQPDYLGWGWCGWMDQWESAEPFMQHSGIQDAFGNYHQPICDEMRRFAADIYSIANI